MKTVIVNHFTYQTLGNRAFELPHSHPSLTVPGMTLSLQELVERYVRGQDVERFTPHYSDDFPDFPDNYEKMDSFDKMQYASRLRDGIAAYQQRTSEVPVEPPPVPVVETPKGEAH